MDFKLPVLTKLQLEYFNMPNKNSLNEEVQEELFTTEQSQESTFEYISFSKNEANTQIEEGTNTTDTLSKSIAKDGNITTNQNLFETGLFTSLADTVTGALTDTTSGFVKASSEDTGVMANVAAVDTKAAVKSNEDIEEISISFIESEPPPTQSAVVTKALNAMFSSLSDSVIAALNGEIDEATGQGKTGDCWLLSGILALSATPNGKEIIKNAIQINSDGSVTVSFKGAGKSYTISPSEINEYEYNDTYSSGDNDMLVLELAAAKLRKDLKGKSLDGGYSEDALFWLTGVKATVLRPSKSDIIFGSWWSKHITKPLSQLGNAIQNAYYYVKYGADRVISKQYYNSSQIKNFLSSKVNNPNVAATFSLVTGIDHTAKCTNGEVFSYDKNKGNHILTITNCDENTVTFVNPWDSGKSYTMTYAEFAKLHIFDLEKVDVSKVNPVDVTKDENGNVTQKTYQNGQSETYEYASNGSLLSTTYYDKNGIMLKKTDINKYSEIPHYDTNGNLSYISQYADQILASNNYYDSDGTLIGKIFSDGTSENYTYDKNGNKISASLYSSYFNDESNTLVATIYYKDGKENKVVYADNRSEVYEYDSQGNKTNAFCYDSNGTNVATLYYTNGLKTKKVNSDGSSEVYEYAPYLQALLERMSTGIQSSIMLPDNIPIWTISYYDKEGYITKKLAPDGTYETYTHDANKNKITTCYDYENNKIKTINPDGSYEVYEYASDETNPENCNKKLTATIYYDKKGKETKKVNTNGNYETYTYDSEGQKTTTCFDKNNRIIKKIYANGSETYDYDQNGNKIASYWYNTTGVKTSTITYNSKGVATKKVYQNGPYETYTYDAKGNKTTKCYDKSGTITKKVNPDGSYESYTYRKVLFWRYKQTYIYDENGKLINSAKTKI